MIKKRSNVILYDEILKFLKRVNFNFLIKSCDNSLTSVKVFIKNKNPINLSDWVCLFSQKKWLYVDLSG